MIEAPDVDIYIRQLKLMEAEQLILLEELDRELGPKKREILEKEAEKGVTVYDSRVEELERLRERLIKPTIVGLD